MDYRDFFRGKKITVLGLGLLGRGVQDVAFLAECGADLIVTDMKTKEELAPSLDKLKKFTGIKFVLGEHRLEDFRNRDFILKGAGIPLDSPYIAEARKNNIPIEMDASLFQKLAPEGVTIVGVTGTRGKSTTAVLIYEIVKRGFKIPRIAEQSSLRGRQDSGFKKRTKGKVFLAGNIKDKATLPLLKEVQGGDIVVLELDSWQLQGFGEDKISPNISVFTTFYPDHMNYYGGDMVKYFEDKANIYKYQRQGDVLVVGEQVEKIQDSPNSRAKLATGQARFKIQERDGKVIARASDVPSMWKVKLLGEHNRLNIACAIKVARALKIDVEDIKEVVENFEGVEGRLQFLREVNGVKIYNDNNSTTPEATMAALKAVHGDLRFKSKDSRGEDKSIILIMGGADKNLDMTELIVEIPKYCKSVIMLPGSGSEKLHAKRNTLHASVVDVADLNQAVQKGMELARRGDVLLFSPAFASFGPPPGGFKNEYDRGEQFVRIANSL